MLCPHCGEEISGVEAPVTFSCGFPLCGAETTYHLHCAPSDDRNARCLKHRGMSPLPPPKEEKKAKTATQEKSTGSDSSGKMTDDVVLSHSVSLPDQSGSRPVDLAKTAPQTGSHNAMSTGHVGVFCAHFAHGTGSTLALADRARRLVRPGAILLPNLDLDRLEASGNRAVMLDAGNINSDVPKLDLEDVSRLAVVEDPSLAREAATIALRLGDCDKTRITVFEVDKLRMAVKLGQEVDRGVDVWSTNVEFSLPVDRLAQGALSYWIEARTLPSRRAVADVRPPALEQLLGPVPSSRPRYTWRPPGGMRLPESELPVARAPGEVWLELEHRNASSAVVGRDFALFTIAPFLLPSPLCQASKLWVAAVGDDNNDAKGNLLFGNQFFRTELRRALHGTDVEIFEIPVAQDDDVFIQDQMILGYCSAPHGWMQVAFHCSKAQRELAEYVKRSIAGPGIGLFHESENWGNQKNSLNFGGNVVATPPVNKAPRGKILIGQDPERENDRLVEFFEDQGLQPVVRVDTSWLKVGHVDEVVSFVPATQRADGVGAAGWMMLIANADLAIRILQFASTVKCLRGIRVSGFFLYDLPRFEDIGTTLKRYEPFRNAEGGPMSSTPPLDRTGHPYQTKIDATETRLKLALGIKSPDILRVPVLIAAGGPKHSALLPNMANLIRVAKRVVVPKPWGPRVSPGDAVKILGALGLPGGVLAAFDSLAPALCTEIVEGKPKQEAEIAKNLGADKWKITEVSEPRDWARFELLHASVDLFEAYMALQLESIGLTCHFVDDWNWCHKLDGDIHCATNIMRVPGDEERAWWRAS